MIASNLELIARVIRTDRAEILRQLTAFNQEPPTPAANAAALLMLHEARTTVNLIEQLIPRELLGRVTPLIPPPCEHTFEVPIRVVASPIPAPRPMPTSVPVA